MTSGVQASTRKFDLGCRLYRELMHHKVSRMGESSDAVSWEPVT